MNSDRWVNVMILIGLLVVIVMLIVGVHHSTTYSYKYGENPPAGMTVAMLVIGLVGVFLMLKGMGVL